MERGNRGRVMVGLFFVIKLLTVVIGTTPNECKRSETTKDYKPASRASAEFGF